MTTSPLEVAKPLIAAAAFGGHPPGGDGIGRTAVPHGETNDGAPESSKVGRMPFGFDAALSVPLKIMEYTGPLMLLLLIMPEFEELPLPTHPFFP